MGVVTFTAPDWPLQVSAKSPIGETLKNIAKY